MFGVFFYFYLCYNFVKYSKKDVRNLSKNKILHLLSSNNFTNIENTISQSMKLLENDFEFAYASPNGQISKILSSKEVNYLPI